MTFGELGRLLSMAALVLAAITASRLASPRRSPAHAPVAFALGIAAAANLARPILKSGGAPIAIDRALYLAFPALSAVLAVEVLALRWSRWAIAARVAIGWAWMAAALAIAVAAPPRRSPVLETFMSWAQLAALGVQLAAAVAFVVGALLAGKRPIPDGTQTIVLVLLAGDLAERAGPWLYGRPARDWDLARWQWAVAYAVVCYLQRRRLTWAEQIHARAGRRGSWRSAPPRH